MKLIKICTSILLTTIALSFLMHCKTIEPKALISSIQPPIEGLEINKNVFIYSPSTEKRYKTNKGTEVIIPSNCLTYEDGTEVKEDVEIEFSEFHNMAEIALSGIPMVYDSAGVKTNFISGGMFSIEGETVEGKKVIIKEDKEIVINLASNKPGEFDFFSMNEQSGEWTIINELVNETKIDTAPSLPLVPAKTGVNDLILDLNISKFNGTYSFESNMWKVLGEISNGDRTKISKTKWTKYELETIDEKSLIYSVKLKNKKEEMTVKATPVLSPNDLEKCKTGVANQLADMQKDLASNFYKPRVVRKVRIKDFGVRNCDVFVVTDQNLVADLKVEGVNTSEIDFFQFDVTRDMMINVSNGSLQFNPSSRNVLIGILPDDKLAIYSPSDFDKLKNLEKGSEVEIILKKQDIKIESAEDLQQVIVDYI